MRKWLMVGMVAVMLVADGCSARVPQPGGGGNAPQPPAAATPTSTEGPHATDLPPNPCAPADTKTAILQVYGAFTERRMALPGNCRFLVDTGPIRLDAQVAADDADQALQALHVTGARQTWSPGVTLYSPGIWSVRLNLDRGPAGQEIKVTIPNPTDGAPPITATLVRKAGPTVHVTWLQADGTWASLAPGDSLPPGSKRLRFQTAGGVNLSSLNERFYKIGWKPLTPDDFTLLPDGQAEAFFRAPPPMVQMLFEGLADANGLRVPADTLTHFYLGEPPTRATLDLTTGQSKTIGPAPPSIYHTVVRPDGRYVALVAPAPDSDFAFQVWLSDLATGKLLMTPFRYSLLADLGTPIFDAKGRLIAPLEGGHIGVLDPVTGHAEEQESAATMWEAFSPDGRYAAGRGGEPRGISLGAWVGPPKADRLVIRDLLQGTERVFPWAGYFGGLAWLPDGRLVQTTINSNHEPSSGEDTKPHSSTVDLQTGALIPYTGTLPGAPDSYVPPPAAYHSQQPGDRFLTRLLGDQALVLRWSNPSQVRTWRGP